MEVETFPPGAQKYSEIWCPCGDSPYGLRTVREKAQAPHPCLKSCLFLQHTSAGMGFQQGIQGQLTHLSLRMQWYRTPEPRNSWQVSYKEVEPCLLSMLCES